MQGQNAVSTCASRLFFICNEIPHGISLVLLGSIIKLLSIDAANKSKPALPDVAFDN